VATLPTVIEFAVTPGSGTPPPLLVVVPAGVLEGALAEVFPLL
jgi:hypothetical protein